MHEAEVSLVRIKCNHKGCFTHFQIFTGCGMRFAHKHVRDNHEKTGNQVYTPGDFEESDEHFKSRPRGGQKRKCPTVEMLIRKRVTPPSQLDEGSDYLSWLISQRTDEEQ
ncbi:hypothetical protein FH972_020613 [Carpinus fangiana]|uniref:C2H2-type domain-containing protein n=1 Tax=Carpinus fangiana TaxID=176857 RepID=A0A5N6RY53_9ROSI|nr:hypothetical protein FH972_020613 [Carpinus fangiana]